MRSRSCLYIVMLGLLLSGCSNNAPDSDKSKTEISELYLEMGARYLEIGKIDIAMEKLEYSLKMNPENGETHDALAVLYQQVGETAKAEVHYKESLRLTPNKPATLNNYGQFLCSQGHYQRGLDLLRKVIAMPLYSRKWFAYTNAGICEYKQGNKQAAEQNYREALQLQSTYAPALEEMIQVSYENGNFMSGRAFLERYQQVALHTARTLRLGMQIELALGNQDKANEYRYQLLEKFPASKEAGQARQSNR